MKNMRNLVLKDCDCLIVREALFPAGIILSGSQNRKPTTPCEQDSNQHKTQVMTPLNEVVQL